MGDTSCAKFKLYPSQPLFNLVQIQSKVGKNSNIIKRAQCAETNSGMGLALFINLSIESKIGI